MPLDRNISTNSAIITLEDIRRYYFEHTKHTLRIEDAKYLKERSEEIGLTKDNGGVEALFKTLKYNLEDQQS